MQSKQKLRILRVTPSRARYSYKNPTVGLKNRVQLPHPGTTPKLFFPVNKLQILYSWDICNNLIKTHEAPYANCSATSYNHHSAVIIIIAKKITLIRLISMTEL